MSWTAVCLKCGDKLEKIWHAGSLLGLHCKTCERDIFLLADQLSKEEKLKDKIKQLEEEVEHLEEEVEHLEGEIERRNEY